MSFDMHMAAHDAAITLAKRLSDKNGKRVTVAITYHVDDGDEQPLAQGMVHQHPLKPMPTWMQQ